jgi:hypothetical protein
VIEQTNQVDLANRIVPSCLQWHLIFDEPHAETRRANQPAAGVTEAEKRQREMLLDARRRFGRRRHAVMALDEIGLRMLRSARRDPPVVLVLGDQFVDIKRGHHVCKAQLSVYLRLIFAQPQQRA